MSRIAFQAAANRDSVARDILKEAKEQLVHLVLGAYESLPGTASHILVVSGGVFKNESFKMDFDEDIRKYTEGLTPVYLTIPPVIGSYILALKHAGATITEHMKTMVKRSWANLSKGDVDISGKK